MTNIFERLVSRPCFDGNLNGAWVDARERERNWDKSSWLSFPGRPQ